MKETDFNEYRDIVLPRRDLREDAFRRYEPFIAKALECSITINPRTEMTPPMKAYTFCTRFRDALLGYVRYMYTPKLFPVDADVSVLKAHEHPNGNVIIENLISNERGKSDAKFQLSASDKPACIALFERLNKIMPEDEVIPEGWCILYNNEAERQWLESIVNHTHTPDYYNLSLEHIPHKKMYSVI